jgi:hypothetical protein
LDEKYQTTTWIEKNLSKKHNDKHMDEVFTKMLMKHTNYLRNQEPTKRVLNNIKKERFI